MNRYYFTLVQLLTSLAANIFNFIVFFQIFEVRSAFVAFKLIIVLAKCCDTRVTWTKFGCPKTNQESPGVKKTILETRFRFENTHWVHYTHEKPRKLLQICKQVVARCCQADIRMCSHCLFPPVVVTSLEQVVIILLQG